MKILLRGAKYFTPSGFVDGDIAVDSQSVYKNCLPDNFTSDIEININGCFVIPGFVDVHTHLREPGFSYKESILSGTKAAAKGGYTSLCTMPNVHPVPDNLENLQQQLEIIKRDAITEVLPYGSITQGEKGLALSDMENLSPLVVAFSDDGVGVAKKNIMLDAMTKAAKLDKIIAAHCEDVTLIKKGGCIHEGRFAKKHNLTGINAKSEWLQVKRDILLCKKTGCKYHVCHVSTKKSVDIIRKAKKKGINVTCETAPHYLCFSENDLVDEGRFKMNPPIRTEKDRQALIEGIIDGTIDIIATDHAPHSVAEKSGGLTDSKMGVSGLETSFAALYTYLIKKGIISLEKLIYCMAISPRKIFGIDKLGITLDSPNLAVLDLNACWTVKGEEFVSKGKSSPYEGKTLYGQNILTIKDGRIIWQKRN